ncbi:Right handed beta helix region, partial [Aliiroseovarius sediminilitoris]
MAVFNVSNAAELKDALSKANGGDEIVLASGDYGHLGLDSKTDFNVKYSSEIVIRSGNSNDPAVFSSMKLGQVENITFDGILFDYEYSSGDTKYSKPFLVTKSENVTIKNSEFRGDVAGSENLGTAQGLNVKESTGVTVESTEFSLWHRGLIVTDSSDIKVLNNDVHSMRSDGLDFAAVQNVLIEGNYIHDFTGSSDPGDHRDFIQFWTNGTDVPSTNVTIRDNILDIGEGSWAQSIFIRNEEVDNGRAGEEMFYQDFVIEGNYIRNVHLHGITTGESNGLTIKDNVLISAEPNLDDTANAYHFDTYGDRSLMRVPTIRVNPESDDVSIKGNQFFGSEGYAERSDDRIFDTQTDKGIDNVPNGWEISNNSIDASSQGPAVPDYASSSSSNNNSDAADDAAAQAAAEAAAQAAAEAAAQAAAEAAAQA